MSLLAFLLPLLIGLALCLLLATRLGQGWVLVWLAPGLGIGLTSVLFFLWSLVFYPRFQSGLYLGLEIALLGGLVLALAHAVRQDGSRLDLRVPRMPRIGLAEGLLDAALAAGLVAALVFFVYAFLKQTAENPLGGPDAWTIWNYRARFLLLGDAQSWRGVFSTDVSHPDYPYLLTGFIARCWVLIGKDRTFVPVITAGLYTLSTVGALGALVARFRGLRTGSLASLVLLTVPVFTWTCANQYADLPLAFYFLAALIFLFLYTTGGQVPLALTAAGAAAGLALWTKNEGVSFALSLGLAVIIWQAAQRAGWRTGIHRVAILLAGMLPLLLLYLGYRAMLVPQTDLFAVRPAGGLLAQLTDGSRYMTILQAQWGMLLTWGWWKLPFLPCLAGYVLLAGVRRLQACERGGLWLLVGILVLTFMQYMAIFLITPFDLAWHLSTANPRLYNQLLPGLLLVIFLWTRSGFGYEVAAGRDTPVA